MTLKTRKWDVVEHLKTEEDMALYLQACLNEAPDDAAFIAAALGDIAKARGMSQIAQESGLGRESLYKTFAPGSKPRFDTIAKVVHSLGLHFQITPLRAS